MRLFVAAGAGEEIGGGDRGDEPAEDHHFEYAQAAADKQIDRQRRKHRQAAQDTWRDKTAMARHRERVAARGCMHQGADIIANRWQ